MAHCSHAQPIYIYSGFYINRQTDAVSRNSQTPSKNWINIPTGDSLNRITVSMSTSLVLSNLLPP